MRIYKNDIIKASAISTGADSRKDAIKRLKHKK